MVFEKIEMTIIYQSAKVFICNGYKRISTGLTVLFLIFEINTASPKFADKLHCCHRVDSISFRDVTSI